MIDIILILYNGWFNPNDDDDNDDNDDDDDDDDNDGT